MSQVENFPEGEIAEMIEIYMKAGISLDDARLVACTLAKYPKFWVEHMLLHEIGILPPSEEDSSWRSSTAMFVSFLLFGFVPILSYIVTGIVFGQENLQHYGLSVACIVTLATLYGLGFMKSKIVESDPVWGGLQMAFQGAVAGSISYLVGVQIGGGGT